MQSVRCPRPQCSSSLAEDVLVKKILLTHDPDGHCVDSESLLQMMENVMYYATTSNVSRLDLRAIAIENLWNRVVGSHEVPLSDTIYGISHEAPLSDTIYEISHEVPLSDTSYGISHEVPLSHTIYGISHEIFFSISQILCKCFEDGDLQARIMDVFELLGSYSWDAKVVIVLLAFATKYGEFWLIMQLCPLNPLAVSVAMLKQLPGDLGAFKQQFKALTLLVKTMLEVTKCVIEFEGLPLQHVKLEAEAMVATRHSTSTTIATWEISSLVYWVSCIHDNLRRQVDLCHNQIETKLDRKLSDLFKETHDDNQEILKKLFALEDGFQLKHGYTQAKVKVSELKNKEVILFITKPKIGSVEDLLLLVQQTYDHPQQNEFKRQYEIIWVPIPCSCRWSDVEEKEYHQFSNALPWYSICQPWRLSAAIVNYIRREWHFMEEPLMVVLDRFGRVSSSNAMDMIWIWGGPKAFPFSVARELQLWEEARWSLELLVDEINSLMSYWVKQGRTLCLYGSDDLEWIREFTHLMKEVRSAGVQLELVYVGKKDFDEHIRDIIDTITKGNLGGSLSYLKMHFFWLRLESMKRSKLRLGRTSDADGVLKEVDSLLSPNASVDGWGVIGEGSSTDFMKLGGKQLIECFKLFQFWGNDIGKMGFLGAIRNALEPPSPPPPVVKDPCNRSSVIPYIEGLTQGTQVCEECKRPMEKQILYQCLVAE
ncbi:protein SIEVE ELEMENT OCCLUSION C isoform X2 [Macadamia integrifolia]|uniref:protein SIEVE ELEMENT OCCLUSION C isoform X2 n=1 Tax=Macadamia integrifolia TaxID=60698 RepID=UPI001C52F12D|nr:protein SIEVE ELEMENT OCCLUSION C isoform X2 [Macadamia integrifolia]